MTNDDKQFLGKPIDGDISHYSEGIAEQHEPQEFINLLDKLVNLPHVENVRWEQYTPYFNDGEACIFGIHEVRVKLDVSDEDDGDYEDGYLDAYSLYNLGPGATYSEKCANAIYSYNNIDTNDIYDALTNLGSVIQHHYAIMSTKFGDPAQVIYDGEGFQVEYYEHE